MKCVKFKKTSAGKKCAKFSGSKKRSGTKGKKCAAFSKKSGVKRCKRFK